MIRKFFSGLICTNVFLLIIVIIELVETASQ